jgi:hypothetical protein
VNLPQVEVIGLQTAQTFFEHLQCEAGIAAMGTSFGHQENFVAAAFQSDAHPDFGFSPAILPAVVKKGDPAIDCLVDDFDCGLLVWSFAQMMASEAQSRNPRVSAAKLSQRNGSARRLGHSFPLSQNQFGIK